MSRKGARRAAAIASSLFRAADPVGIFLDDLVAALGSHLTEVMKLGLRMLINAGDPHI